MSTVGWNVADATVKLGPATSLKTMTSDNKVRARAAADMKKSKGAGNSKYQC